MKLQILAEIEAERNRQDAIHPTSAHLPDGTSDTEDRQFARDTARIFTDQAAKVGELTWVHVLREEFLEALAEVDPAKIRAELIQVAAVCARWAEDIDSRAV